MSRFLIFLFIAVTGCDYSKNSNSEKRDKKDETLRSYSKDGILLSEIDFKDGKRHGVGKSYYKNGNLQLYIPYVQGKRHGVVKRYYQDGKIYQETEFDNDVQVGYQKTYKESGQLRSEARFEDGFICTGLTEYLLDGTEKKKYPTIEVKIDDRIAERGEYTVHISLSDNSRKVKFYRGELTKAGCMNEGVVKLPFSDQTGQAELRYVLPVGTFVMEEVNIIAEVTTLAGNSYLTQRRINIAIDN